jgi:putative transcriptional regulator
VTPLEGQLLVASPGMFDPNFRRTVVLIAVHTDEGAMGLVLNRPTELTVGQATGALAQLTGPAELVHQGGPVSPQNVIVLAEFDDPDLAAQIVLGDIGFLPAEADIDELVPSVRRARVFAGHAGWGPDQLESEMERDDWIVEPATPDDVFSDGGEDLWASVLERKGGEYALVARMPPDPSLN